MTAGEVPTVRNMWEEGMSFACPRCGDWLPTQAAYARFRGNMPWTHQCLCNATTTEDPLGPASLPDANVRP